MKLSLIGALLLAGLVMLIDAAKIHKRLAQAHHEDSTFNRAIRHEPEARAQQQTQYSGYQITTEPSQYTDKITGELVNYGDSRFSWTEYYNRQKDNYYNYTNKEGRYIAYSDGEWDWDEYFECKDGCAQEDE
ncbi:hypothetical protein FGO68_gene14829 [Halteria grandinella]|uniref:Uncharacterized protein n=1 Tax=Halteria grandinella TaxID=5974 RepID=A0A8J8NIA3_HALGN|nr:hypothetical protein FGO68_gene14829 [Halteria grandinella]